METKSITEQYIEEREEKKTIKYWAERYVKAQAFSRCASIRARKVNHFDYSEKAIARIYLGISLDEFLAQREAYISAHPMRYAPTTKKLTYLAA